MLKSPEKDIMKVSQEGSGEVFKRLCCTLGAQW
jgi:hypothetical protein